MSGRHKRARALAVRLSGLGLIAAALAAPISIAAVQIALGVSAAGVLLALLAGARWSRSPLDLPLAACAAAALISTLAAAFSPDGPGSPASFTLWRHIAGFFVAWQALALAGAEEPSSASGGPGARRLAGRAMLAAALGLAAASILGLVQYRTGIDLVHAMGLRAQPRLVEAPGVPGRYAAMGFFISRLTFGHNALVWIAFFAGALLFGGAPRSPSAGAAPGSPGLSRGTRLALAGATLLALAALLLTFDRAAWLGLFAAALALAAAAQLQSFAYQYSTKKLINEESIAAQAAAPETAAGAPGRARRGWLAGLAVFAALLALAAAAPGVRARFASGFSVASNGDRVFLWSRAKEIIRDHPLFGVGFGNYPRVCPRYYDRVDPSFPMRTWAHDSILSLWAETGPLGLAALAFFAWSLARAALARIRAGGNLAAGALAAASALATVGLVHDVVYDSKVMYPLWLALALGLSPAPDATDAPAAGPELSS